MNARVSMPSVVEQCSPRCPNSLSQILSGYSKQSGITTEQFAFCKMAPFVLSQGIGGISLQDSPARRRHLNRFVPCAVLAGEIVALEQCRYEMAA